MRTIYSGILLLSLLGCSTTPQPSHTYETPKGAPEGYLEPIRAGSLVSEALIEQVRARNVGVPNAGYCSIQEEGVSSPTRCPSLLFTFIDGEGRDLAYVRTDSDGSFRIPGAYGQTTRVRLKSGRFRLDHVEVRNRGARDTSLFLFVRPSSEK